MPPSRKRDEAVMPPTPGAYRTMLMAASSPRAPRAAGGFVDVSYRNGVYLDGCSLWLDPLRSQESAIVSHAHSDHVRRHRVTISTPGTAELMRRRYGYKTTAVCHEFGEPFRYGEAQVTFYPAGHVLGSAQVLVDDGSRRLLYSGDVRLRPSAAAETAEVPRADVLIMETTFGLPRYVFPDEAEVVAGIVDFCEHAFAREETPVLLAYSLGKAQEAVMILHRHGIKVAAHSSMLTLCEAYQEHGVAMPDCTEQRGRPEGRTVVICPPHVRGTALAEIGKRRTAMLSGWAMDAGARYRYQCDAAFALSDHCGYDDLLRYVELVGAREVYTVHGFVQEFAADLQRRGVAAYALNRPTQLALPGLI